MEKPVYSYMGFIFKLIKLIKMKFIAIIVLFVIGTNSSKAQSDAYGLRYTKDTFRKSSINLPATIYIIDGKKWNFKISPFSVIIASDIKNINVLKDSDAIAKYGQKGIGGVVIITTKNEYFKNSIKKYHDTTQ